MTRLYLHSTDPVIASKMKPEVIRRIVERRRRLAAILIETLERTDQITLEIGCGHGHFLTAYSQSHPNEYCIGIDVNRGRIFRALRKAEKAGLKNLAFYECDSTEFLHVLPEPMRIEKTWILYPDPWPKKRHFKNRIIQSEFLDKLAPAMTATGTLYLRSDYQPYLEWARELIEQSACWKLQDDFNWPEVATTVFQELTDNRHFSLCAQLEPVEKGHEGKLPEHGDDQQ